NDDKMPVAGQGAAKGVSEKGSDPLGVAGKLRRTSRGLTPFRIGEVINTVRFGLIGYGAWGSHHARAIAPAAGAELAAIAGRSEQSRARAQAAHPAAHVYEDYRDLLERENLDVVDVVLPTDRHFEAAKAVLESGRHLLIEKPLALTLADCDALIALAR